MRNLKKVLVLVLCLAMMASIMVTGAAAAFTDAQDIDSKHQEAVDMSVALNIIEGYPDGSFKPNGNVTRAEMAKIICIALNGGQVPATAVKPTPTFADTDGHWAEGFIEYCFAKGVVAGKDANTFDPNGQVTGTEAAKMLLVALGYNADVEKYVGDEWALYVNVQANQDGLYDKLLDIETAAPLSREHAAQMIWNALQSGIIYKYSSIDREDGSIRDTYEKTNTELLTESYKGDTVTGIMEEFKWNSTDKDWTYTVNGNEYDSANDYTALLGQDVKVVFGYDKNGDIDTTYGIFANKSVVKVTGVIGDLPDIAAGDNSFKVDGTKYKLDTAADAIPVYFFENNQLYSNTGNGLKLLDVAVKNAAAYDAYNFSAVDQNGDGDIDFFLVQPYIVASVSFLNSDKVTLKAQTNAQVFTDNQFFGKKGELEDVTYYEGMAKNDYVIFTPAKNTAKDTATIEKADLVSGKISVKDGNDVTIEGTTYTVDASFRGNADMNKVYAGAGLTDAVIKNGYIFTVDSFSAKDIKDFVIVNKLTGDEGAGANSMAGDQAQLIFTDGSKNVVDLAQNYKFGDSKVAALNPGAAGKQIVTYKVTGDNEYKLFPIDQNNISGYDLIAYAHDGDQITVGTIKNGDTKAGCVTAKGISANFTSDSVVYLMDSDGVSVKNGDQIMKMKADAFQKFDQAFVLATKSGNTYNVALAYLSIDDDKNADNFYGYVTSCVEKENANLDQAFELTLWTATGEKVLFAESNDSEFNVDKGALIEYQTNSKGEISDIVNVYAVDSTKFQDATANDDGFGTIGATQWTPTVQFKFSNGVAGETGSVAYDKTVNGKFIQTDSDTEYIYIDNSDTKGADSVDMASADDFDADGNTLVPNGFIIFNADGEVSLVVYDVTNDIQE